MIVLVIDARQRLFRAVFGSRHVEIGALIASQQGVLEASVHSMCCWSRFVSSPHDRVTHEAESQLLTRPALGSLTFEDWLLTLVCQEYKIGKFPCH